jgi:hypothetical protein
MQHAAAEAAIRTTAGQMLQAGGNAGLQRELSKRFQVNEDSR